MSAEYSIEGRGIALVVAVIIVLLYIVATQAVLLDKCRMNCPSPAHLGRVPPSGTIGPEKSPPAI